MSREKTFVNMFKVSPVNPSKYFLAYGVALNLFAYEMEKIITKDMSYVEKLAYQSKKNESIKDTLFRY